jgi:putative thioredoxin
MSDRNNPYAGGGYAMQSAGQTEANVTFGGGASAAPDLSGPSASELIRDTTTSAFSADVLRESRNQPVLVDFWAPWCGPCKQLTPVLEKVVREARGRVKLVKLNIDEHPAIPGQLGVQSIPAIIAFKDGQPVDGFMGAVPESQIREFIDRIAKGGSPQIEEALAAAAQAREAGDNQGAAQIYAAILQHEPENADALAALADLFFNAGQVEQAKQLLDQLPTDKKDIPAVAAVHAKMALAEQVAGLGDPAELERRLAENSADHQARFDLALICNARGEREAATDHLLAIMKADREWNEDGARKKLLELFEAWGMTDRATLAGRRKLSSLLFS